MRLEKAYSLELKKSIRATESDAQFPKNAINIWRPLHNSKNDRKWDFRYCARNPTKSCFMWKTLAGLAVLLGSCFRRNDEYGFLHGFFSPAIYNGFAWLKPHFRQFCKSLIWCDAPNYIDYRL